QFALYFFPELGIESRVRDVGLLEREIGRLQAIVVTGDAVAVDRVLLSAERRHPQRHPDSPEPSFHLFNSIEQMSYGSSKMSGPMNRYSLWVMEYAHVLQQ